MFITQKDQVSEEENVSYKTENAHTTHEQTAQAVLISHEDLEAGEGWIGYETDSFIKGSVEMLLIKKINSKLTN